MKFPNNIFRKINSIYYSKLNSPWAGYLVALMLVALATGILTAFLGTLDKANMGLIFILVVAISAAISGIRSALTAAMLGFLCWNFFLLPPYHTFRISDQSDWLMLFVFLVIGMIVGQITGKMKTREAEAVVREKEMEAFYKASMSINTQVTLKEVLPLLVEQIQNNTGAKSCAIIQRSEGEKFIVTAEQGDTAHLKAENTSKIIEVVIQENKSVGLCAPPKDFNSRDINWPASISLQDISGIFAGSNDVFLPLRIEEHTLGVLYVSPGANESFNVTDCRFLVTFASILTIVLERNRLMEEAAEAAAVRESEHLKSVLFSSMSHNLKNPLVSLNATVSSLKEEDFVWDPVIIREHLKYMEEDVSRLMENIENLLNLAQLESGIWKPKQEWYDLREIVGIATSQLSEREYHRIKMEVPDEFLLIWVDSVQFSQVLRHILENALQYSPPDSRVIISAYANNREINFWVDDNGPGVPENEREKIFDKFYHVRNSVKKPGAGTGLGLAICQEIVQAHKGAIKVETSPEGGARFVVSLPKNNEVKR
jgi:two-component system, OmpR family, sensor histidine kinase KdpD